jgi:hypothetical protein
MRFGWDTKKEKALRGFRISAEQKLEGIRLMNELADKVLSKRQKFMRRKLREAR